MSGSSSDAHTEEVPDHPNAKFKPGMVVQSTAPSIVREEEDLDSPQVARLLADTQARVLSIGTGPTKKRIRIRELESGQEGWVSVVGQNPAPLWREVPGLDDHETAERPSVQIASTAPQQRAADAREGERNQPKPLPRPDAGKPTERFNVGDVWAAASTLLVREEEDLERKDNKILSRLEEGAELEVVKIGTGNSGKRICVRSNKGVEGWISVVNSERDELLRLVRGKDSDLFVGLGQSLGGSNAQPATDARAAALAAAERRQKGALAHGLGEKKAKELGEQGKKENLLKRIQEIYAKRQEEVPLALQSSSLETVQKHYEYLTTPASEPAAAKPPPAAAATATSVKAPVTVAATGVGAAASAVSASTPAPARFDPPPRTSEERPLHAAALAVLDKMKANPSLGMLQDMVQQRPTTLPFTVKSLLEEHAEAAALEPRLQSLLERLLRREETQEAAAPAPQVQQSQPKPPVQPKAEEQPPAVKETPPKQVQSQPSKPLKQVEPNTASLPKADDERRQLMEEARSVCGLSNSEMQVVEELESLGFEYRLALEAFLTCERNKELAANYLFENQNAEAAPEVIQNPNAPRLPAVFPGPAPSEKEFRSLTANEREAVQRIQDLGFDRATSMKAYIACAKDEEAAANRLLM